MHRLACVSMAALALCGLAQVATAKPAAKRASKAAIKRPAFEVQAVNDPHTTPLLNPKSGGSGALRAQILLDRQNFSVGQIDGRLGANTLRALAGFRAAQSLPTGDSVDEAVWQALNTDKKPAIITYTITPEDLRGPFTAVPDDMLAKAKLKYLGYASALDELAEKFHSSPALLVELNRGKTLKKAGEQITVPNVARGSVAAASKVVVSKSKSTLTVFDNSGKVIAQYPCSSGSEHDPLPLGEWKVTGTARNPWFHYNPDLFWDAQASDKKAAIPPGPRNPAGLVWIDLSKEHYGIHGTPDASQIGYLQSHGCVRLTNWDALQLAGMVNRGTPVIFEE